MIQSSGKQEPEGEETLEVGRAQTSHLCMEVRQLATQHSRIGKYQNSRDPTP